MSAKVSAKVAAKANRGRQRFSMTLFDHRPEVGGVMLHPLSGGRIAILEERGNPLAMGVAAGTEVASRSVYEVLMVARLGADELLDLADLDDPGWRRAVRKFSLEVPDDELYEFWMILEAEMEAVRAAVAVPKKKRRPAAPAKMT